MWQFQKTTHGKNGSVDRLSGVGQAIASDIEVCAGRGSSTSRLLAHRGVVPVDILLSLVRPRKTAKTKREKSDLQPTEAFCADDLHDLYDLFSLHFSI